MEPRREELEGVKMLSINVHLIRCKPIIVYRLTVTCICIPRTIDSHSQSFVFELSEYTSKLN